MNIINIDRISNQMKIEHSSTCLISYFTCKSTNNFIALAPRNIISGHLSGHFVFKLIADR